MAMQEIQLTNKIELTHDVFELHYEFWEEVSMKPGQFITFILPEVGGRSYSVLETKWTIVKLTIKRRSKESKGRWGSIALCDASVWDSFKVVGPVGHFVLQENKDNKLFIGTGTGIVPLYNQVTSALKNGEPYQIQLIFGVRTQADLFYIDALKDLEKKHDNFSLVICVSREEVTDCHKWYVTDCIDKDTIKVYKEFYICGMPNMIDSCEEKLKELWVPEEKIFFERYA